MAIARQACSRQKEILVAAISRQATEHGMERWRRGQARVSRIYARVIPS